MIANILFVCTGNTCRSPMAEGFLRQIAEKQGINLTIRSAGIAASQGAPLSRHAATILANKGIGVRHNSQSTTAKLLTWADLILTMTVNHKRAMIQSYPQALDKIHLLKEYVEDNPEVLSSIAESESFYSELEMKRVLSQPITVLERQRVWELENSLPDYDIFDPFGGTLADYERCAEELQQLTNKLVKKIFSDQ
ncbi:MAG: low molecular weight protein arginine phosphatase [Paenibacillaceae bacterium]